ncbi:MAG: antibiotic biosynthesis monooxygenase [Phenylobacterium sp.]|uniref:putative quinol monooxygenase n=1 Tax=Phenylobacterium sp. TaxID=1871053 RepID=UPI001B657BDB|nr:putative quinol monooxygenase [Phenylobacterium sp.]MBP7817796.1 antibiotic biosynthesis monooxygenase [Phenylobacterium sp.]MBP9755526.1 antibiotic biosynthesis monooxygenase [Phenylobacterium sp.]
MTVIIAGTVRVPPENLERFKPHMLAMLAASRAEDGCLEYSYAVDVADPGLIRVYEAWRDQAAIDAHFQAPHMAAWRAAWPQFGVGDRQLIAYQTASQRPL